jgi:hypothetical protein
MNSLYIKGTPKTPTVEFLPTGDLKIEGKSIPENCSEFYRPVIDWLDAAKSNPPDKIIFSVKLEYINTSSSKTILNIFKLLQDIAGSSKSNVEIKWYYDLEDEDLLDEGENYKMFTKLPLTLIPY